METADTHHNPFVIGKIEFDDRFLRRSQVAAFVIDEKQKPQNEDLVSEHDYQRRISELELTIAVLNGRVWRADEKLIEMGKANLNLYRQVQAAQNLISIRDARIAELEKG